MTPFYRFQFYLFALMAIGAALLFVTRRVRWPPRSGW
jgi:hypothetical protein